MNNFLYNILKGLLTLLLIWGATGCTLPEENSPSTGVENNYFNTARLIKVDGTRYSDAVDNADYSDYFKIEAKLGKRYVVEIFSNQSEFNSYIELYSTYEEKLLNDDNSGRNKLSKFEFVPEYTGVFYIRTMGFSLYTKYTYSISVTESTPSSIQFPLPEKEWTILIYMDGDNSLSSDTNYDVEEIKAAGGSDSNVNIVVVWDQLTYELDGDKHGYYYITNDESILLRDTGEINMGDPETAKDFLDFALTNFSAKRYLYVFWNHGSGVDRYRRSVATRGVCDDSTNNNDHLNEQEQQEILAYFNTKTGKKMDIVAYDVCNMAAGEIMYQYRDLADYFIASEEQEPAEGWDYNFIKELKAKPIMEAAELSGHIIEYYKNFYPGYTPLTISAIDLSAIKTFASLLNTFCNTAMSSGISPNEFYQPKANTWGFIVNTYVGWDLYDYLNNVNTSSTITSSTVKSAAYDLMTHMTTSLVAYEFHSSDQNGRVSGVTMVLKPSTPLYNLLDLCSDTSWNEFINWAGFKEYEDYTFYNVNYGDTY